MIIVLLIFPVKFNKHSCTFFLKDALMVQKIVNFQCKNCRFDFWRRFRMQIQTWKHKVFVTFPKTLMSLKK